LKQGQQIFILFVSILIASCTGSKKYFKAAEKLEKQGLVNEAAEYYLESLQRKNTNVQARIKLKDVGQKCVSNMASDFFRNINTSQLEASLESFEKLKDFTAKTAALSVVLDYPKQYDDDYKNAVQTFMSKNHDQAYALVNERKFNDAMTYINRIKKYDATYKTTQQLEITAVCEPLYQSAIAQLENKNYNGAFTTLTGIRSKTESYKDSKVLYELSSEARTKYFMLFEPKGSPDKSEKELEDFLFNNFNQIAAQNFEFAKIINNTPFTFLPNVSGGNAADVDLIQGIRKATGADYFYSYDVSERKENNVGPQKTSFKAYQEVKTRKNDTLVITEYKPVDYYVVKASRSYSYMYSYKLINSYSNQIISSQSQIMSTQDAIEFNEFAKQYGGNINTLFPYNPDQTAPAARYNPSNWRKQFSANSQLRTFDQLKVETNNKTISFFSNSILNNIR
jgi:hypothetical protein